MRALCALLVLAGPLAAQETAPDVTRAGGLAAWDRIHAVVAHPRCANCHVGAEGVPGWRGLTYGARALHGMNIRADDSRIGAETVPCRTCHITAPGANATPHSAPQIDDAWRLPPVELAWLGKTSDALCVQLRDPATSDDSTVADLVAHLRTSPFVAWGFAPGGGRSAPPGTPAQLAADVALWGAAGTPCARDN